MAKKPTFSLDDMIDETAVPEQPNIMQRGTEKKKPGPKPKPPRANPAKVSVVLDGELYEALLLRKARERKTHQDIIEAALREYLRK